MTPPPLRWGVEPKPAKLPKQTYNLPRPYCGDQVTVCIASICEWGGNPVVVICTDTKLSLSGFTSFDSAIKISWAAPQVLALMADDPSRAKELLHVYQRYFTERGQLPLTTQNALSEFRQPAHIQKRNIIDEYFQRKWGVAYDEYRNGALGNLPQRTQDDIVSEIEALTLQCQLIITPFIDDRPRLFTVSDDATVAELDHFAAIGSGAWIANASLCQRQYTRSLELKTALYYVYEAKKLSEAEGHVGRRTLIGIFERHRIRFVSALGMRLLESWFAQFRPQPVANVSIPENDFWINADVVLPSVSSSEENETEDDSWTAESDGSEETQDGVRGI